ncbi:MULTISPECIES: tyramine oxidase subunit B [Psychrobacter]|uniref:Ornithine cyclodeaminase n=1 Tax=Psychrobacter fozii TaxID=198480 RepID=A0A2V4UCX1_9GAMM|nr:MULTISPECIES: tyramine oxidase subunit B [Psychrobacter]MBH0065293.1 ornithine cyclodeaminase [Psychrobacter sp. SZ93C1]PYE36509.1 ornithine cyclodeaminase [Psychrobacter fozii]
MTTEYANTKIDFIYLSEPDMIAAGVTDMAQCVDTMDDMFKLLYSGDYRMAGPNNDSHGAMMMFPDESPFPNMPKNTADRRFMAMPAYLGGSFQTTGVKWYGSNTENRGKGLPRSILTFMLNDTDTGAPLALMSANLLSAHRTGAISGVGARYLAKKDSKVVGILGPGVMARTALSALVVTCPQIDTLKIKGRGQKSLNKFIDWVTAAHPQIDVQIVDELEDLVRGSDIVTYCASSVVGDAATYPIIKKEWLKPGAFMAMPAACNIDDALATSDVRKVLDCTGLYEAWFEESDHKPAHNYVPIIGVKFMDMVDEGALKKEDIEDLAKIISGDAPARQNDDEIIILSVGGLPIEDVAWATVVYRNAIEKGIGVKLNLWDTPVLC